MLIFSIKKRADILKARDIAEKVIHTKNFIFFYTPTLETKSGSFVRFLAVVTKKIDKRAVIRNTIKRRIKEAFRQVKHELIKQNYDYQIIAKRNILNVSFQEIVANIEKCLK
jgi:ribonuclease P protein component